MLAERLVTVVELQSGRTEIERARAELVRFMSADAIAALDSYLDARLESRDVAPSRRWLTIDEAAAEVGCSPETFRKRLDRGGLTKHRQGGRIYVDRRELDGKLEESGE